MGYIKWFSIILLTALFFSCELKKTAESTPQISFPAGNITNSNNETLELVKMTNELYYYFRDTLRINDTIRFHAIAYSGYDYLSEFCLNTTDDTTAVVIWNENTINQYVLSREYDTGKFYLKENINYAEFPFMIILKKVNPDFRLVLETVSTASEKFNKHTLTIKLAIAQQPDEIDEDDTDDNNDKEDDNENNNGNDEKDNED